ncbi:MAG: hypothetical protein NTW96_24470 [Planctomycetia bacterium]|nr:hypothetical protein [Planctomycetia bacterium]
MSHQWYDFDSHPEKRIVRHFQADEDDLCGRNDYDLKIGKLIRGWDPKSRLFSTRRKYDGVPDDVLSECLDIPTFSRRLRDALKKASVGTGDIQYLPVHVFKSTGEEIEGYAFANVLTRIAALDYDATDYGPMPPEESDIDPETGKPRVQFLWRAALIGSRLEGHDIIRLREFFPSVFVSERFAEVYHNGDFTGASFTSVITT